jgi:hypothetical protein
MAATQQQQGQTRPAKLVQALPAMTPTLKTLNVMQQRAGHASEGALQAVQQDLLLF